MGSPDTPPHKEGSGVIADGAYRDLTGEMLGEYKVLGPLGEGGMGMVYRGVQPVIGKPVAIKVLKPAFASDPDEVKRLVGEARAVNAIRHPGIIDIFSFGQTKSGEHYFVMELLEGQTLFDVIHERAPLPPTEALSILDSLFAALSAAHKVGVIHRDLKPGNIFYVKSPDGGRYTKILDFGLAKRLSGTTKEHASRQLIVGTPEYMSPEQIELTPIGPPSDLYAMGVIAFELLTGKLPFEGKAYELLSMHVTQRPPKVRMLEPSLPEELEDFVDRLLAKHAEDRPNSAMQARAQVVQLKRSITEASTNTGVDVRRGTSKTDEVRAQTFATPTAMSPKWNSGARTAPRDTQVVERALEATNADKQRPKEPRSVAPFIAGAAVLLVGGVLAVMKPWVTVEQPLAPVDRSKPQSPVPVVAQPPKQPDVADDLAPLPKLPPEPVKKLETPKPVVAEPKRDPKPVVVAVEPKKPPTPTKQSVLAYVQELERRSSNLEPDAALAFKNNVLAKAREQLMDGRDPVAVKASLEKTAAQYGL